MKKETIVTLSAATFVALAAVAGLAFYSNAASISSADIQDDVIAAKQFGFRRHWPRPILTPEQKAQIESRQKEIKAKHDAVINAIEANDYNAWVEAVKQINASAPILQKINSGNFAKLVEAHNNIEKAQTIMKELGIDGPGFGILPPLVRGEFGGRPGGFGRMMGGMMGGWNR